MEGPGTRFPLALLICAIILTFAPVDLKKVGFNGRNERSLFDQLENLAVTDVDEIRPVVRTNDVIQKRDKFSYPEKLEDILDEELDSISLDETEDLPACTQTEDSDSCGSASCKVYTDRSNSQHKVCLCNTGEWFDAAAKSCKDDSECTSEDALGMTHYCVTYQFNLAKIPQLNGKCDRPPSAQNTPIIQPLAQEIRNCLKPPWTISNLLSITEASSSSTWI